MSYEKKMRHYEFGERSCPVCLEPLPAHDTWPGARYRFCGKAECAAQVKSDGKGVYFGSNERKCDGPDCNRFVAEGRYDRIATHYACCVECWIRRRTKGTRPLICGCGCGETFFGKAQRRPIGGLYFKSPRHYGDYLH